MTEWCMEHWILTFIIALFFCDAIGSCVKININRDKNPIITEKELSERIERCKEEIANIEKLSLNNTFAHGLAEGRLAVYRLLQSRL